jgi:hypothetical protein
MNNHYEPFRWAPPAVREHAEAEAADAAAAIAARRTAKAEAFEGELRARYLQTGATEQDWQREKGAVLAEARKQAALSGEDVARAANRARYG